MDTREHWNGLEFVVMVILGSGLIPTHPVAGASLLAFGVLSGLGFVASPVRKHVDAHQREHALLKAVFAVIALVDLFL